MTATSPSDRRGAFSTPDASSPVEAPHIPGAEAMSPEETGSGPACYDATSPRGPSGCVRDLCHSAAGCLFSSSFLRCHGFLDRFAGKECVGAWWRGGRRARRWRSGVAALFFSSCRMMMMPPPPFAATLFLIASTLLGIAEACSSRSTPKPRAPSPTARPNITFHTYACPPAYAAWYCLNGATCFTVKIGESLLYNCECADGYMGQRCEFKDLENSYLPSRRRVMLETASIASGATIAVFLVVIVCLAFYIHFKRKHKPHSETNMSSDPGACQVDGVERRRPFSVMRPHSISLVPIPPNSQQHSSNAELYPAPTHGSIHCHAMRQLTINQGPGPYASEIGDHEHQLPYPGSHLTSFSSPMGGSHWNQRWEVPSSSSSPPLSLIPHYSRPYRGSDPRHSHRDRPPDLPPPPSAPPQRGDFTLRN